MNPAPNLLLVGPMGAGKTAIGRRLAERFSLRFVDADLYLEQSAGASIASIFENSGEAGFREREAATLAELLAQEGLLVSTGGGVVLRAGNRALLRERGFVVYLQVSVPAQLTRLARDRSRPLLLRGDRAQILQTLSAARDPLYREVADLTLDTDGFTSIEATAQLVSQVSSQWQRSGAIA